MTYFRVKAFMREWEQLTLPSTIANAQERHMHGCAVTLIPQLTRQPQVWLGSLRASLPCTGQGTRVMTDLCRLLDKHGVRMCLHPDPFGPRVHQMEPEALEAWYERFGFEVTSGSRYAVLTRYVYPAQSDASKQGLFVVRPTDDQVFARERKQA